jgi:hypothetical protein
MNRSRETEVAHANWVRDFKEKERELEVSKH